MNTVDVPLGDRSYTIHIQNGILNRVGEILQGLQLSTEIVVLSNKQVVAYHGNKLLRSLRRAHIQAETVLLPDGERYKTLATLEKVCLELSRLRVGRGGLIAAFGGGVIGDIAGFVAASYLRGLQYVQIPTTLLAQIDSAIGGKTGVNLSTGKNLVGAFHQPRAVIADPLLLTTLAPREFRSGLFEAIKYGVIRSPSLFDLVSQRHSRFPRRDRSSLERMIFECARIKAEVVSRDETETELRMILNYGHTLGHALESATNYRQFTHGEAIGHGMILANLLAGHFDWLEPAEGDRINAAIQSISPLPPLKRLRWKKIFLHMLADKKFSGQRLRFVLPRCLGRVEIMKDVPQSAVEGILRSYLHAQR